MGFIISLCFGSDIMGGEHSCHLWKTQPPITHFMGFDFRLSSMSMHNVLRYHFFTPIKNLMWDFMYGILSQEWWNVKIRSAETFTTYFIISCEMNIWIIGKAKIFVVRIYELNKITFCNRNFCGTEIFFSAGKHEELWSVF